MPTADQTRHWLSWLAQQLQQESKDEFLIEGLQPTNLKNRAQQKIYNWICGLNFGLIGGLNFGLIWGLIGALIGGVIEHVIEPVETFEFSLSLSKIRGFLQEMLDWMIVGMIAGMIVGINWGLIVGLILGLIAGLILGLIIGVIKWLQVDFASRKHSNQGIFASLQNNIWIALFSILIFSFATFFISQVSGGQANILYPLISGIGVSIIIGFWMSGDEALKHFILRCLLYRNGSIPWNYARFLNYSTERMLLQRIGGRYRFIHRLLQEHFAAQISDN
jgi:hypothetical protein